MIKLLKCINNMDKYNINSLNLMMIIYKIILNKQMIKCKYINKINILNLIIINLCSSINILKH